MASSSLIKPGEKGKVTVKIDLKHRRGSIYKSIQVVSNDPKKHTVVLSIKALIN